MTAPASGSSRPLLIGILAFLGLLRLVSLGLFPLADTTEARYGEIARLMVSSGDWITPQIDKGVPFWGKPPLSTWASALSFKVLGIHEFAARFPSLLFSLAVVALVYAWARHERGTPYALAASVVLATSAVFFISSGVVLTDPALLLGTTVSMVAFHRALSAEGPSPRAWGYAFFVGLAISLLAKGPVGVVLTLLPTSAWVLRQRNWKEAWERLPWVRGLLLTLALSLPWYLLAELKTPGFWDYFFVGEHWKRFTEPGWKGDLYGRAHTQPHGMIWLFWIVSALPWSFLAIGALGRKQWRQRLAHLYHGDAPFNAYLLLWMLAPLLFFTLAGNILWTYVLPGLPAFALLVAQFWPHDQQGHASGDGQRLFPHVAVGMATLFALALLVMTSSLVPQRTCQKELITAVRNMQTPGARLSYLYDRPFSAQFYSAGEALELRNPADALELLADQTPDYFVVRRHLLPQLPEPLRARLENLGEYHGYLLLREIPNCSTGP